MGLTFSNAKKFIKEYEEISSPTEEDNFHFTECLEYLIHETNDPYYMTILGGYYYERKQFDLAEEYYLLAAELKYEAAYACLGYIYYYGRTGKPNYQKAFEYYSKASEVGDITSAYKVTDMYRNGYYVKKDNQKYTEIIKSLYPKIKNTKILFDPLPEIYSCLAKIYKNEGQIEKAVELLLYAKNFQAQRLQYTSFFGDLTIMKYIILDLYSMIEFDETSIDLFDLYYTLQYPCDVILHIHNQDHIIQVKNDGNKPYIVMDNKNFEDIDNFFSRAKIDNEKLSSLAYKIDYLAVTKWKS